MITTPVQIGSLDKSGASLRARARASRLLTVLVVAAGRRVVEAAPEIACDVVLAEMRSISERFLAESESTQAALADAHVRYEQAERDYAEHKNDCIAQSPAVVEEFNQAARAFRSARSEMWYWHGQFILAAARRLEEYCLAQGAAPERSWVTP